MAQTFEGYYRDSRVQSNECFIKQKITKVEVLIKTDVEAVHGEGDMFWQISKCSYRPQAVRKLHKHASDTMETSEQV